MKTRLINLWKNVVEFISMMFGFGAILAITAIAMAVVSVVSNFMATHQWVILIFDVTCVVLLTMAICYRLDLNFQTSKGKWLFWLLFSNVLILIIQSFGAVWNFVVMLFILWPLAIGISQLIERSFKDFFWWLVSKWGIFAMIMMIYCGIVLVLSLNKTLVGTPKMVSLSVALFLMTIHIVLTIALFWKNVIVKKV